MTASPAQRPFVLGFGSPLIDHLARVTPEAVTGYGLVHGGMKLVDAPEVDRLQKLAGASKAAPGGSAANTAIALSHLGGPAAFAGVVGKDELGAFFRSELGRAGVREHLAEHPTEATGRVLACVTPDGERSFATCLGAALHFSEERLDPAWFRGAAYVYLEGYLIPNRPLVKKIVKLAKEAGALVALDAASPNVVEEHRDAFRELVEGEADVVFANAEEALALTGVAGPSALEKLRKTLKIAVVKMGDQGSLVARGAETHHERIQKVPAVDTTGAGDYYAAGFLWGVLGKKSLSTCAGAGSLLSRTIVQTWGASLPDAAWEDLRRQAALL